MKTEIGTALLIISMIVAAALYTNPPGIRCTLVDNKKECVSIEQGQKTKEIPAKEKAH